MAQNLMQFKFRLFKLIWQLKILISSLLGSTLVQGVLATVSMQRKKLCLNADWDIMIVVRYRGPGDVGKVFSAV